MAISSFDRAHKVTNLGLSRFALWLPVLLRASLLLLFIWYFIELLFKVKGLGANLFLVFLGLLFVVTFVLVMLYTYREKLEEKDLLKTSTAMPLWPFILINLLMILLVSVLGKWDRDRGAQEVTTGLLGFTSYWAQKIGNLLTGRG